MFLQTSPAVTREQSVADGVDVDLVNPWRIKLAR